MSWIMPHAAFIDDAAKRLVPLCAAVGASSLQWDAEEPWTRAKQALSRSTAADRIADRFSGLTCEMGITGIGAASVAKKLAPLAAICDYTVPQAYSTSKSGVVPGKGQRRIHARYATNFGRRIEMGLAAFRQAGIKGHTIKSAMTACVEASRDLGCQAIIYWHLNSIRKSKLVAKQIAEIRA